MAKYYRPEHEDAYRRIEREGKANNFHVQDICALADQPPTKQ